MKQPAEKPVNAKKRDHDSVSKEVLLSEEDASKVSGGATTGGSVIMVKHPPFKERA
ncbi:MAG: hypothetical protein PHC80_09325 [Eubacteriales bacterium]|nr:hypothetical protein [Eubacteriales bacterium]